MRITDLRIHSIAMADPPLRSSYGLHQPYALRNVIELESEDGIIGIAETYGGEEPATALENLRDRVVQANPWSLLGDLIPLIEGGASGMERSQTHHVPGENPLDADARSYAAIETACLDLIGKTLEVPVCDLIGGRVRDAVSFSAYPFYKHGGGGGEGEDRRDDEYGEALTPEQLVGQVKQMVDRYGFKDIKFKAGVVDPEIEIETIKQLRLELGPDVPLRIDPNCAWSIDTSVKVGLALADELSNGGYLEDPTAGLDGMAEVRKRLLYEGVDIPLASNVSVTSFGDLPETVKQDAVQIILCDHHYWGGMRQVQHLAKTCQTFGIGLSMHSNSHLGISLLAMSHVAAATHHLSYACDTHYPWQSEQDEIVEGGRITINNGEVLIPDSGGLGTKLDYDQIARGKELYRSIPYRKRDDEAEMQKHVDPDWKRILPRW
ncbi:MAG: glucarate dehydratase [Opitutae bacterium]|mgnify:FL=1|nr:glucarate dehydratase [Opitutae bacterium]|tara:strand:+ start:7956 stop:9260 length:1305 start_codon:yes stop_codon:yes gene_type:complete